MFAHVDRANMPTYCARILDLLRPKGMALIQGVTLTGLDDAPSADGWKWSIPKTCTRIARAAEMVGSA